MITERTKHLEYAIRDVVLPAKKLEAQGHKILKLNIGDPCKYDFDAPEQAKQAYIQAIKDGKSFYSNSNGVEEARQAIAEREQRINQIETNPDQVRVTSGVSETINFICASLMQNKEEMLVPSPSYPQYLSFPPFYGGKAVEYKCDPSDWHPDIDDIKEKISDKTRAISIINPNNPTGAIYSKKTLEAIIELAIDHDLIITSDEIYDEIIFDEYHCPTKLAVDKGAKVVQMNGMSKNFFAPGWRVGYSVFHNCDELMEACSKQGRTRLCPSTPAQYALAHCMNGCRKFLEENKKRVLNRINIIDKRCKEIGFDLVKPKGAFYAFPSIGDVDDKQWVYDLLHEKHVLTVFGSGFGEQGKGHFRLVALPQEEVLEEAFDRIAEFVEERKRI